MTKFQISLHRTLTTVIETEFILGLVTEYILWILRNRSTFQLMHRNVYLNNCIVGLSKIVLQKELPRNEMPK